MLRDGSKSVAVKRRKKGEDPRGRTIATGFFISCQAKNDSGIYARRDSFATRLIYWRARARGPKGDGGKARMARRPSRRSRLLFPRINFPARVITEQRLLKRNGCCWYISMVIFTRRAHDDKLRRVNSALFLRGVDWNTKRFIVMK